MNSLFAARDYKHFLRTRLASPEPFLVKQAELAKIAGCKPSYLSQCLNGKVHLLPEQAYAIGSFLRLDAEEIEYFCLLLDYERSGTQSHRTYLKQRMKTLREARLRISNRLQVEARQHARRDDLEIYYRDWFLVAVHILGTLKGIRGAEDVATRLGLTLHQAKQAVETLTSMGLLETSGGELRATNQHLSISDKDPLVAKHHANWRMVAALRPHPAPPTDVHYTAVYSMSKKEARDLGDLITQTLFKIRERVKPSPEECVVALGIDWFQLA